MQSYILPPWPGLHPQWHGHQEGRQIRANVGPCQYAVHHQCQKKVLLLSQFYHYLQIADQLQWLLLELVALALVLVKQK